MNFAEITATAYSQSDSAAARRPWGDDTSSKSESISDTTNNALIPAKLVGIRFGARNINLYEFEALDGRALPPVTPGSHIDVHIPNGLVRQYSLLEAGPSLKSYLIGVKRDENSRGGSSFLHEQIRVGTTLTIGSPRNNFPLAEDAKHSVLIAGGIGITPIWCMWSALKQRGSSVELIYSCRSRAEALFINRLSAGDKVMLNFDDESQNRVLDLVRVLSRVPKESHLFCCGPMPMLKAFEAASADWAADHVHVEYFKPAAEAAIDGGFTVELARSGKEVRVMPGQSILVALREAGIDAPYSCEEGICGACMTTVISGQPDHRDSVLTTAERSSGKKIMICCSGSKTDRLVLDL
ncbi:MAG TPA: PDR/VanB family oxidoreductase [Pseudolabrys sp.]|nr:PDR/VanB family oxidoreductase [Pseudolabrys sp.]